VLPEPWVLQGEVGEMLWSGHQISVTYDVEKYGDNFCEYTPMMFAFVFLIIKWVRSDKDKIY